MGKFALGIAEAYNPKFARLKPKTNGAPKVVEFAKSFLEKMINKTITKDVFDTTAQRALFPTLPAFADQIKPLGKIEKLEFLGKKTAGSLRQFTYRAIFENVTVVYLFVLDKEKKVAGFVLKPE